MKLRNRAKVFFLLFLVYHLSGIQTIAQVIDLEHDLVLKLPFNGNALDESGEGVTTSVMGPILTMDRFDNPNSAYLFNGISDYIELNNNNALITSESFTICMWAQLNGHSLAQNKSNTLFEQRDDDANVGSSESIIHFTADFSDQIWMLMSSSGEHVPNNQTKCIYSIDANWHHFVVRFNEDKSVHIFLDGSVYCSGNYSNTGNFTTSIDHVSIGGLHYSGVTKGAFNGKIDEVYIYNRALNDCEIVTLYSGNEYIER